MYRVRSYPFVFIENRVGKMVVIIASVMMQPYLAVSWRRWQVTVHRDGVDSTNSSGNG